MTKQIWHDRHKVGADIVAERRLFTDRSRYLDSNPQQAFAPTLNQNSLRYLQNSSPQDRSKHGSYLTSMGQMSDDKQGMTESQKSNLIMTSTIYRRGACAFPTVAEIYKESHRIAGLRTMSKMYSTAAQPIKSSASPIIAPQTEGGNKALNDKQIFQWISELVTGNNRERALLELGKKREQYDDLALVLWNSFGVMTVLLEEIVSVYPFLNPPVLTASVSNRVCNALALLQCVASNNQTRTLFLGANLPLYLYPFLSTNARQRSFEYLRLTSLGVIGALVKNDTPEVINFLLTTEIVPLCLNIMEISSELSKTVAIFILQKILLDDQGLTYVCTTYERFHTVSSVLSKMIEQLSASTENPQQPNLDQPPHLQSSQSTPSSSSGRLLKHVVRCYMRLSDNLEARKALSSILPEPLRDGTFSNILQDDLPTKRCLAQLLSNINGQT